MKSAKKKLKKAVMERVESGKELWKGAKYRYNKIERFAGKTREKAQPYIKKLREYADTQAKIDARREKLENNSFTGNFGFLTKKKKKEKEHEFKWF